MKTGLSPAAASTPRRHSTRSTSSPSVSLMTAVAVAGTSVLLPLILVSWGQHRHRVAGFWADAELVGMSRGGGDGHSGTNVLARRSGSASSSSSSSSSPRRRLNDVTGSGPSRGTQESTWWWDESIWDDNIWTRGRTQLLARAPTFPLWPKCAANGSSSSVGDEDDGGADGTASSTTTTTTTVATTTTKGTSGEAEGGNATSTQDGAPSAGFDNPSSASPSATTTTSPAAEINEISTTLENRCECGLPGGWIGRPVSSGGGARVYGGGEVDLPHKYPWLVYLASAGCGGALLNRKFVLTAAHCIRDEAIKENTYEAWFGVHNVETKAGVRKVKVIKAIKHPDYHNLGIPSSKYFPFPMRDIAILELEKEVSFNPWIQPVCLPDAEDLPDFAGMNLTAAGWGVTKIGTPRPTNLQEIQLTASSVEECQKAFCPWGHFLIQESHLCAGGSGGKGVCFGDSGGPLVWQNPRNGRSFVVGVVSFGNPCALPGLPRRLHSSFPLHRLDSQGNCSR